MKTANKILLVVNLLLMAAVFTGNYFFLTVGGSDIKALTSGGFVLMGLVNLIFAVAVKGRQVKYVATLAAGLTLACLGDILIGPSFVIGAALFALGSPSISESRTSRTAPSLTPTITLGRKSLLPTISSASLREEKCGRDIVNIRSISLT